MSQALGQFIRFFTASSICRILLSAGLAVTGLAEPAVVARSHVQKKEPTQSQTRSSRKAKAEETSTSLSSRRQRTRHGKLAKAESEGQERHGRRKHERGQRADLALKSKKDKRGSKNAKLPPSHVDKVEEEAARQRAHDAEVARQEENQDLGKAYSLYDAGSNQRLLGNYAAAIPQLMEARQRFHLASQRQVPAPKSDEGEQENVGDHLGKGAPMESFALFELAQAFEGAKNYELAKRSFQECLFMNPKFLPAYLRLSCLEARQGNADEALRIARRASSLAPADPRPHFIASVLLGQLGMPAEARAEQQRACDLCHVNKIQGPP